MRFRPSRPAGMLGFSVVWFGQFVSLVGSGMSSFALTIWAWQITGQATALALVGFFSFAPTVLLSPIAGALVDRWNRKLVMILSDLAAGLSTIAILTLLLLDRLEIWHLYVAGAFSGVFGSFQFPAYNAAITTMIPKQHYGRANAMVGMAGSATEVIAPILAGALLVVLGIRGVLVIDIATFVFAILVLLCVVIPQPEETRHGREAHGSVWSESLYGFKYMLEHRSFLALILLILGANITLLIGLTVLPPMVLARTGSDELILGAVQTALGIGGVAGGLIMSLWGGPKRKILGVLVGLAGLSLVGEVVIGLGRSTYLWATGAFFVTFFLALLNTSSGAIWQVKVPPDVQGRVFAVRRMVGALGAPVAMLIAGPLADYVFEPLMTSGGPLAATLGRVVGSGPGAGMSLMFVLGGGIGLILALAGLANRKLRDIDALVPDHASE